MVKQYNLFASDTLEKIENCKKMSVQTKMDLPVRYSLDITEKLPVLPEPENVEKRKLMK